MCVTLSPGSKIDQTPLNLLSFMPLMNWEVFESVPEILCYSICCHRKDLKPDFTIAVKLFCMVSFNFLMLLTLVHKITNPPTHKMRSANSTIMLNSHFFHIQRKIENTCIFLVHCKCKILYLHLDF